MAIQFNNTNTGTITLAPPASGSNTLTFPAQGGTILAVDTATLITLPYIKLAPPNTYSSSNPATTGTTPVGVIGTINPATYNQEINFGIGAGSVFWIQNTNKTAYNVNYDIALNPNGGRIGIGTMAPGAPLHVQSSSSNPCILMSDTGTNGANIKMTGNGATTPSKHIRAYNGSLEVVNNAYTTVIFSITDAGAVVAANNITAYSDERLKRDWNSLPKTFVENLSKIKSGTYTRIDSGDRQAGSSAQEWQKLLPEVVLIGSDEDQTLSLAYGNAALVSAIELAKDNVELRSRIEKLEAIVAALSDNSK